MRNLLALCLGVGLSTTVIAKPITFKSEVTLTPLIELYSSQGCSSCPPAERWLSSLKNHKRLWKDFVPVEFHVAYWNYLGWTDSFSQKQFEKRQRAYSAEWGSSRIYTPGFVLAGNEWRDRFRTIPKKSMAKVGVLEATHQGGGKFNISFSPTTVGNDKFIVYAALLGNGIKTDVTKGENAGETLRHEFVVLNLSKAQTTRKGARHTTTIRLPLKSKAKTSSKSVAFWVTKSNRIAPLQAVGGHLSSTY